MRIPTGRSRMTTSERFAPVTPVLTCNLRSRLGTCSRSAFSSTMRLVAAADGVLGGVQWEPMVIATAGWLKRTRHSTMLRTGRISLDATHAVAVARNPVFSVMEGHVGCI